MQELAVKDAQIADLKQKMEDMALEFGEMLKETLVERERKRRECGRQGGRKYWSREGEGVSLTRGTLERGWRLRDDRE